jgi:hypothetical protein
MTAQHPGEHVAPDSKPSHVPNLPPPAPSPKRWLELRDHRRGFASGASRDRTGDLLLADPCMLKGAPGRTTETCGSGSEPRSSTGNPWCVTNARVTRRACVRCAGMTCATRSARCRLPAASISSASVTRWATPSSPRRAVASMPVPPLSAPPASPSRFGAARGTRRTSECGASEYGAQLRKCYVF